MVNGRWVIENGQHADQEQSAEAFTQVLRTLLA
jgi:formimidoylglutamate deiminase